MATAVTTQDLGSEAEARGAAGLGVTTADPFPVERRRLIEAVDSGRSGPLHFTYDDPVSATDIRVSFPWAERLVVVAWNYLAGSPPSDPTGGFVARFATRDHYHQLETITANVAEMLTDAGHRAEIVIDDNRLVDRAAAVRAGVGWWGKSTMVLAPGHGPWLILGTVVTDAPLETTEPMIRDCGTCTACLPACPTGALSTSRGLDARRCLATWLQAPGSLPHWIRPLLGTRVYGCDDCLTSCPPGHRALTEGPAAEKWGISDLLALDDDELLARVPWWYVPRREGRFLRRNLLIAAGNSTDPDLVQAVERHLHHASSMVRGHAASALARLLGPDAGPVLRDRLEHEAVREAIDELIMALLSVEHPAAHAALLVADEWVSTSESLLGLAIMGSHAVAAGGPTSDLDLLVLTAQPGQVVPPGSLGTAHRGLPIRLGRALGHQIRGSVPIDLVIGPLDWPTDGGGENALANGIVPVNDPQRRLESLRRRSQ